MKRFWQKWSYWDLEDKLVWVGKRLITLLTLSVIAVVTMGLIWGVVIVWQLFVGTNTENLVNWVAFTVLFAGNFYMLDGALWD